MSATATSKADSGTANDADKPERPGQAPSRVVASGKRPARRRLTRRGFGTSLTARVLAVNVLALAILVAGFFYLERYQNELFDAKIDALTREGALIAGALGESVVESGQAGESRLDPNIARTMLQRLAIPFGTRIRLFDSSGALMVDSLRLPGARMQTKMLPPPDRGGVLRRFANAAYDWLAAGLPPGTRTPVAEQYESLTVGGLPEAARALRGEIGSAIRQSDLGSLVVQVALPVQPLRRIQGALLISASAEDVQRSVREVRFTVLRAFAIALGITVLLSLYLAGTITRPVRRLAEAAERVRAGQGRKVSIPDFTSRRDEIGDLSAALHDMTEALWVRMDAIERFVADVAHEIKNPLSSVRSAVETAQRIDDPAQRQQLLDIVAQDVNRLDRLLSEIADASRLDTELARAEATRLDLEGMLSTLVDIQQATGPTDGTAPRVALDVEGDGPFVVMAVQDRLAQVFQNLLSNARSFSPPGGRITLHLRREGGLVRADVEDEGPGVANAMREAIFERFYSFRPEGEAFGSHSGLGLSISRQILEAHGGSIVCENRTGASGARFVVRLPAED